jgi:hypothetical protein
MKVRYIAMAVAALMFAALSASASPPSPGPSTPTTQNATAAKERLLDLVAKKKKVREVDVDLCRIADDGHAGCDGAICSCCKADGCYICNSQWTDCVFDTKASAIRGSQATTVSPGTNAGTNSGATSGSPKKPTAKRPFGAPSKKEQDSPASRTTRP